VKLDQHQRRSDVGEAAECVKSTKHWQASSARRVRLKKKKAVACYTVYRTENIITHFCERRIEDSNQVETMKTYLPHWAKCWCELFDSSRPEKRNSLFYTVSQKRSHL